MTFKITKLEKECEEINQNFLKLTACFTGHRNQKLPWGFNEKDIRYILTKIQTKNVIKNAIINGKTHFISGMAIGFDMMCAEIILEFKQKYPKITLECALPCKGQENKWSPICKEKYHKILKQADRIRCIYDHYVEGCMQERNKYMVNASSLVIALYNGRAGGTKETIEYAKMQEKEILYISPRESLELSNNDIKLLKDYFS